MKFEVGRAYRRRNGEKAIIDIIDISTGIPISAPLSGLPYWHHPDGTSCIGSDEHDLVAYWEEPSATPEADLESLKREIYEHFFPHSADYYPGGEIGIGQMIDYLASKGLLTLGKGETDGYVTLTKDEWRVVSEFILYHGDDLATLDQPAIAIQKSKADE